MVQDKHWKLSPSDFAFLWEECKRCFYLKVVKGFSRPQAPMPKIFMVIDGQMETFFSGMRTEKIAAGLPEGIIQYGEKWVESKTISTPNCSSTCFIKGKFDTIAKFKDGSYGVIDFKTSARNSEHIPLYSRQLHAYAYTLENAAPGKLSLSPINRLGLLIYEPSFFSSSNMKSLSLEGNLLWLEITRDDHEFETFIREVLLILDQPTPPNSNPNCKWCQYRDKSRQTSF